MSINSTLNLSLNTSNLSNSRNAFENIKQGVTSGLHIQDLLSNGFLALLILIVGIILGKCLSFVLRKIFTKLDIQKHMKSSLVDLIIVVTRWAIYIVFLHLALRQLDIEVINSIFGNVLITIPAFIAALVLMSLGFVIAVFLKSVIKETMSEKGELFSQVLFYFVIYIFGVYSIKVALITLGDLISNYIVIALTLVVPIAVAILYKKFQIPQ